ncbi:uncharacterized protein LOC116848572 [Odontomachus brunneus]|uniref:uncharacterized protein LOC116848572 n=1 Tax=Odontomachus brunneus TaxID=486640 RepID=UPI0013F24180|nr:uncharacterized protein LOC116848572 [Odontomachus brunneus]
MRRDYYDGHEEDRSDDDDDDDDDDARVSVAGVRSGDGPRDDYKHEDAFREDYIRAEEKKEVVDAVSRVGVSNGAGEASSFSSSAGRKRQRERVDDGYGHDCPTVDEQFHGRERRRKRRKRSAGGENNERRRGGGGGDDGGSGNREGVGVDKPRSTHRSYYRLLLFVLYLLAWPLLCSTSASGHLASTFAQNPTLAHAKNPAQRNATPLYTNLFSSSTVVVHQHQQPQQYVQGSDYNTDDSERHRHHQEQPKQQPQQQRQQQEQASQEPRQQERKEKREQVDQESEVWDPHEEYIWEVNQLNPWLSACDLAGPAPADLQGSCGPPEVPKNCPLPCATTSRDVFREVIDGSRVSGDASTTTMSSSATTTTTTTTRTTSTMTRTTIKTKTKTGVESGDRHGAYTEEAGVRTAPEQCLFYLEESHKRDICRDDFGRASTRSFLTPRENRYWFMSGLRLRHCCEHAVVNALAPGKGGPLNDVLNGGLKCADALDKLLLVDALAARLHCEFEEVLARYDCAQPYSVIHNCTHCKEAYRKWVCSSLVPYFAHGGPMDAKSLGGSWTGTRLRPCRSICQSVEQRCPYLLPGDRAPAYPTQYAGEPTFLCRDPNIPETGGQAARALHNSDDDECCFHVCSEDAPGSGICANCTEPWKHGRVHDPSTAPHCEINIPQAGFTGEQNTDSQAGQPEVTTDRGLVDGDGDGDDDQDTDGASSSTTITPTSSTTVGQQDTSFCGSGRIGSIPSASSLGRSTPPVVLQLLWLFWMILIFLSGNGALRNNSLVSSFALLRLIGSSCLLLRTRLGLEGGSLRFAFFGSRAAKIAVVRSLLFVLGMSRRAVMKCRRRGWWWWRSWRRSSSRHFRWKSRLKEEERRPRVLRRFGGRARGRARLDHKDPARVPVAMPRGISRRITRSRRWERYRWCSSRGADDPGSCRCRRKPRPPTADKRTPDVAFWRSVLRDASISILGLSPKLAACSRRFRDWWCWWLWRWWRECRDTEPRDAFVSSRRKDCTAVCGTRRRRGRRRRRRSSSSRRRRRKRRRGTSGLLERDVACSAKSTSRKDPP